MCARVGFYDDADWHDALSKYYGPYQDQVGELRPRFNIAPSQQLPALLNSGDYLYTHFGLIPHWSKDPKVTPVNARAETLSQKVSFRDAFRQRRCLIPANGYYEWRREGKTKIPYWIHPTEKAFFAFAGLWDRWLDSDNAEIITSTAIITTEPNEKMAKIHDRMPVILKPADWSVWLDPTIEDSVPLSPLLSAFNENQMGAYEVSTYVNKPSNDTPRCMEPMKNLLF